MQLGEIYEIPHKGGETMHGQLLKTWEDEDFEWFCFAILENSPITEAGWLDESRRESWYIADYSQRKTADYAGIEKHTNMPIAYAGKMLQDFNWNYYPGGIPEQRRQVEYFMSKYKQFHEGGKGIYIHSRIRGSGKTLLASCIANEIMRRHMYQVKFINVMDYVQRNYDKDDNGIRATQEFRDATVLILDDIGAQDDDKRDASRILYELVDYRYGNHKTTIFTSNEPIDKCTSEDRTWQRILEMAPVEIKLPEVSVRRMLAEMARKAFMESIA